MNYSIGEVAQKMGTNTSTLRYYDKKGLLPFVDRDDAGRRKFKDNDFNFLEVINCLKKSGVPIKDIGKFINLCLQGDETLRERYDYLDKEENVLEIKVREMQEQLDFLRFKKWYYKTSVEAGTETIHFTPGTKFVDPSTHDQYKTALKTNNDLRQLLDLQS
ncbi:MerR family transcriptional regulator [Paucilactobacillus hokkaidonensis JCM 18461]|uniref:MerR family transcriptional regulator n=2 Tax=Paucilactobacillus hokkaidonensis TaxID=1193095 RepID=A0A0A1GSY5_9LACO|nr:MerR family transcriptional regulator [Paucilactobacillus hokkaidonensis]KRO11368.1 MerR family transcriptional regulator [Paucilactobacillus hokkaidonensis]BAP85080.1 MerR family transcriptional regulator [Paucilactobacillus hokkaidonensis JCM 18461]